MTPYYEDGSVTIYHGDCRLLPVVGDVALVLTDPPYGVQERTNRASAGRGTMPGKTGGTGLNIGKHQAAPSRDFPPVYGDDEPFDPALLIASYDRLILWGANHYADRLPPSPSWIIWDKLDGLTTDKRYIGVDDNADLEMAWTNCGGPARLVPHRWKGMVRASEQSEQHVHPTQKPVWLMERLIEWRTEPGDLVFDPYMGSGPVARACKNLGRRYVGVEIEERYCEVAVRRVAQEVMDFGGVA